MSPLARWWRAQQVSSLGRVAYSVLHAPREAHTSSPVPGRVQAVPAASLAVRLDTLPRANSLKKMKALHAEGDEMRSTHLRNMLNGIEYT